MRITTGQSIWGEDDDGLKFAQARLIPQAVQGWAIETTTTDPVIPTVCLSFAPCCIT